MRMSEFSDSPSGHQVPTIEGQLAFVPAPLAREMKIGNSLIRRLDDASRAVATLAGVGETVPNPHLLISPFIRREAVLSSRIEGTQASLSDLFLYEALGHRRATGDVTEVSNYVHALERGLELLRTLPISFRLINEMHKVLLTRVRGEQARPGELRSQQVWIGSPGTPIEEARFIPPPAELIRDLLADWEQFVNDNLEMPPLIQCALMHYQFEAIHPYLDGNGRIGRLLIVLFLCAKGLLPTPLLYLSAYFERDRDRYYDQLLNVSATGAWEAWLDYFLTGVAEQAHDALLRIRGVRQLLDRSRRLLQERRESGNALRLLDELFARAYMTAPMAASLLNVTSAGARQILVRLAAAGVIEEIEGTWPKLYLARELFEVIEAPTATE